MKTDRSLRLGIALFCACVVSGCASAGSTREAGHPVIQHTFYKNGTLKSEKLRNPFEESSIYKTFYEDGSLKSVTAYRYGVKDGISREYYPSGQLRRAVEYRNNLIDGIFNQYYEDGRLWIHAQYVVGDLVRQQTYDEDGRPLGQATGEGPAISKLEVIEADE